LEGEQKVRRVKGQSIYMKEEKKAQNVMLHKTVAGTNEDKTKLMFCANPARDRT